MATLAVALGALVGGGEGVLWALLVTAFALLLNPALAPETLLRLYGARRLAADEAPGLHLLLAELAKRAGLQPPPTLWYLPSGVLNAFALGAGGRAAVTVSDGLLRALSARELAGVLAHEICHLRNHDTWVMGLADLLTRLTHLLAIAGLLLLALQLPLAVFGFAAGGAGLGAMLLLVLSPSLSALLQLGLSRTREFDADMGAVALTGDPRALASALQRIERFQAHPFERVLLPGRRDPEPSLLRGHPPTGERVRRLLALLPDTRRGVMHVPGDIDWTARRTGVGAPRWRLSGLWH